MHMRWSGGRFCRIYGNALAAELDDAKSELLHGRAKLLKAEEDA